eukprot:gene6144-6610_t
MLKYDYRAFYDFALLILVIYVLPCTCYVISEFIAALGEVGAKRTKNEKDKANEPKKQTTGWARLNTTSYITNLALMVVAWTIFLYLINLVKNDPYTILGIEPGSTVAQIKKKYHKLYLQYHPNNNMGDQVAEEIFTRIMKAYEELTLSVASSNCELTATFRLCLLLLFVSFGINIGLIILLIIVARGSTSSLSKEKILPEDGVRPATDSNTPSLDVAINPSE